MRNRGVWRKIVLIAVLGGVFIDGARAYPGFDRIQSLYPLPSAKDYGGAVVLKFRNGSNLEAVADRALFFQSAGAAADSDLAQMRGALVRANAGSPRRLFTRPAGELQAERARAEGKVGMELPDLTQFFTVAVGDYQAARELLATLRTNKLVEVVYARPQPVPPPTPDFTSYQTYFNSAAANGYDIQYARNWPGGDGSQARLIDVEYQWEYLHEDLQKDFTNILWGTQYTSFGPDHGTAALGISGALSNSYGMEGIIHEGRIDMVCATDSGGFWVLADAINHAVSFTAPGDVILLEQQAYTYVLTNYCPVEYYPDVYSAIANATALDRVIIEPTGNGGLDLDDPAWGGIFQRATRDSGAIMVGAGTAANRSRCSFSCYGSRVDIQGWGDWSVATLGYGDLYGSYSANFYTAGFSGTSSASALSAGIAALVESYARASYAFYLPPLDLRSNLVQSGFPQTFGLPGDIGPLPNVSNALAGVDGFATAPPEILLQPVGRTNFVGTSAAFNVTARGTPPLSYQWKRNGIDLVNGGNVSGATTPALALSSVWPGDAGVYTVLASNALGTTLSSNATLTLLYGTVIVPWGDNAFGQTDVPAGLTDVIAISSGPDSVHSLALRGDHTVVAWGWNGEGETDVPAGLSNVVAVAAGGMHNLALQADGTVAAWGWNGEGETNVPADLTGVAAIAAGYKHNLALKTNGTVVAWGDNAYGQTDMPSGLSNVVAVAAGNIHSLALKTDGTVAAWGNDSYGQTDVPAGLSNVVAIAAGDSHNLAAKADGTVAAWGWNGEGETDIPPGLSNVVAIAGGYEHCLALQADGTVVAWGWNGEGETNVPAGLSNVMAIAAGAAHSLALVDASAPVILKQPSGQTVTSGTTALLSVSAVGVRPLSFQWQKDGVKLNDGGNVSGSTTSSLSLSNVQEADTGAYTVIVTNIVGGVTSAPAALDVKALRLRLERNGNSIAIYWPTEPAGMVLESSGRLSPAVWGPAGGVVEQVGSEFRVQMNLPATNCFYRLRLSLP